METCLCGHCGGLFNFTPFGPELVSEDARKRFPEYASIYDVDAWNGNDSCADCNEKIKYHPPLPLTPPPKTEYVLTTLPRLENNTFLNRLTEWLWRKR
jgi:hypothetical protein